MVRGVLGFVIGAVLWMPAFFLVVFSWRSDRRSTRRGQVWFEHQRLHLRAAMSVVNATAWALAAVFAGWVAVAIARRRRRRGRSPRCSPVPGILAPYLYWPNFPWWYNVAVAGLAAPAALLGGKLARVA